MAGEEFNWMTVTRKAETTTTAGNNPVTKTTVTTAKGRLEVKPKCGGNNAFEALTVFIIGVSILATAIILHQKNGK